MSNRVRDIGAGPPNRQLAAHAPPWFIGVIGLALWLVCWAFPGTSPCRAETDGGAKPIPRLVKARQGDTAGSLAERYLQDANRGWMIREYNAADSFADGQPVLIPMAPYRPGGLFPDGYQHVPVLVYDDIGESTGPGGRIAAEQFHEQMVWLKNEGFTTISPDELVAFMAFSGQLPAKAVLITIDSQSRRFFDHGAPILAALGFRATLFVATDAVGTNGAMSWAELAQLQDRGFTIGCRGRSGQPLLHKRKSLDMKAHFNAVVTDLKQAKQTIETHLKRPCTVLAWPHGETHQLLAAVAAKLGFAAAFLRSAGDTPFFADRHGIHRIVIETGTTAEQFARRLDPLRIKADLH